MNDPQALPPQPRAGGGCCGLGCMSFAAFFIFLVVAFAAGAFWALRQARHTYSSDQPQALPQLEAPASTDADASATDDTAPTTTAPDAANATVRTLTGPVEQRWNAFLNAADRGEKVRIELSAADINRLIASDPQTRGKAVVRIENNIGHVAVSIPLDGVTFLSGRYLNGEATVRASPDGDPAKAQITDVVIANETVPENFVNRRLFGWWSVRGYVDDWLRGQNVSVFRIENNRVIGETR